MGGFTAVTNLTTAIQKVTKSFSANEAAIAVVSNNVANISTPGYARQVPIVDVTSDTPSAPITRRQTLLEGEVRSRQQAASFAGESLNLAQQLEGLIPVAGQGGLDQTISGLFESFSTLSANPNSQSSRQAVLDQAKAFSSGFQRLGQSITTQTSQTDTKIRESVSQVNQLADQLAKLNQSTRNAALNPEVDAQRYALLDQLSQQIEVNPVAQPDGTLSIYIGNGEPLVLGDQAYGLNATFTSTSAGVQDYRGASIEGNLRGGILTAQLLHRNEVLPQTQASLNNLAKGLADSINAQWNAGLDQNGATPASNLFTYIAGAEAGTLSVTAGLTTADVPAASGGAAGGNGNALALAQLRNSPVAGANSASDAYADLASQIGRTVSKASEDQKLETSVLTEAQSLRDKASGVSLDQEAADLIRLQRAYQASAQMLKTLDELTNTVINIFSR